MKPLSVAAFLALLTSAMTLSALPVYIGSYSPAIVVADFDPATGELSASRDAAPLAGASFLAKSADARFLYAVGEGKPGALHAFAIGADGALTALNSVSSVGGGPCDIALSPDGKLVAAANYGGGSVIAYRVRADGALGALAGFFQHEGAANVFPERQKQPHAHGVTWSPDGKLLLVPDLGADHLYVYSREAVTDALEIHRTQPWLDLPPGSGPRHAQFSPDGRHLYIINELGNTVSVAAYEASTGTLKMIETVSTLPPGGHSGPTKTAEIAVSNDGRTVYASNRGHDTLALFARDPATGALTPRGHVPVPAHPRHFALSPDGRWLLAAGQDANRVAVFAVDPATGSLTATPHGLDLRKPVCVRF